MDEVTAAIARLLQHREWAEASRRFLGKNNAELLAETERCIGGAEEIE